MLSLFEIVIDPRSRDLSTKLLIAELVSCTYCMYRKFYYLSLERSADFLYSSSLTDIFLQSFTDLLKNSYGVKNGRVSYYHFFGDP